MRTQDRHAQQPAGGFGLGGCALSRRARGRFRNGDITLTTDQLLGNIQKFEELEICNMMISPDIEELREMAFKEMRLEEKRAVKRPALIKKKLMVQR